MDVLGLEPARKLLQLLEPAGESGVRIDQLPNDLRAPRLLTVLDGETLVEFGQRSYSRHNVTNEVTVEPGFSWRSWLGPNTKPIELFLPELLERVPEVLRPFVRLTYQGRLAAAKISLSVATSIAVVPDERKPEKSAGDNPADALRKSWKLAFLAYAYAEAKLGCQLTDREAWEYLDEHGIRQDGDEIEGYDLPLFGTFADYCTKARKAMGQQRNKPRGGRAAGSRSVVRRSDT